MTDNETEDDPFDVPDVDNEPPPQEFRPSKKLLEKKADDADVQVKSGSSGGTPPPLAPPERPAPPSIVRSTPPPSPAVKVDAPRAAPEDLLRKIGEATKKPAPEAAAEADHVEIRKPTTEAQRPKPSLAPLEGPVEIRKPVSEAPKPKAALPSAPGPFNVVLDTHAKAPQSERLKVAKPKKRLGIVDTTFARFNMGAAAKDEVEKTQGEYEILRRTVPGIKDLAVECKILLEEEDCDLVVACGMVGKMPIDKQCAHEASLAIQWAMLQTNRHILEVFVHEDEAKDDAQLAWLMDRRTREHALNAHWMLSAPEELAAQAGQGLRQGFDDAGPVRLP